MDRRLMQSTSTHNGLGVAWQGNPTSHDLRIIQLLIKKMPSVFRDRTVATGVVIYNDDISGVKELIEDHVITALNNDADVPFVMNELYDKADSNHKKDAELCLITSLFWIDKSKCWWEPIQPATLYMVVSKGPCKSCRRVITSEFRKLYKNMRIVVWYPKNELSMDGRSTYGFQETQTLKCSFGGFATVCRAKEG